MHLYAFDCTHFVHTNSLACHRVSNHLPLEQLLSHVKEMFSEILLSVETVTKLELIGKGMYIIVIHIRT